jgi:hypothetical protein
MTHAISTGRRGRVGEWGPTAIYISSTETPTTGVGGFDRPTGQLMAP